MILTDEEMQQVRKCVEAQAGLDEELVRQCGNLIRMGAFDEAVRSAFVLLEERLRKAVSREGMTGVQLANYAFNSEKGPLAKLLSYGQSEQDGLRELFSGAFKLFRNPTAHGVVGYSPAEGKAIIGLVDLMLKILKRAGELPPPDLFPDYAEKALSEVEGAIGPAAASRLRVFLGKCVRELGLKIHPGKIWIPFRKSALYRSPSWDAPRHHPIAVFYLVVSRQEPGLYFATSTYAHVVGFNVDRLVEALTGLRFQLDGKAQEPVVDLRLCNDQEFFDALFDLVRHVADELAQTLRQE
jgi:uncharacterized protein (TIGR02391 family)